MQEPTTSHQGEDPEYPPAIILNEAGDTAEGVIERWSKGPSKFHPEEDIVIAVLRQDDGSLGSFWLNATVLTSKFARLKPKIGERVIVTYKGKREGATAVYRDYDVEMPERAPFEPDWSGMSDELIDDMGGAT